MTVCFISTLRSAYSHTTGGLKRGGEESWKGLGRSSRLGTPHPPPQAGFLPWDAGFLRLVSSWTGSLLPSEEAPSSCILQCRKFFFVWRISFKNLIQKSASVSLPLSVPSSEGPELIMPLPHGNSPCTWSKGPVYYIYYVPSKPFLFNPSVLKSFPQDMVYRPFSSPFTP